MERCCNKIGGAAIFLFIEMFFLWVIYPQIADSGTYLSTRHGNATSGVDRSAISGVGDPYSGASKYSKGHCGHCHEQHASVAKTEPTPPSAEGATLYELFRSNYGANKNELCFACHETFSLSGMTIGYGRYGIYQGKTKYNNSIHKINANMLWSPDPSPPGPKYNDSGNCNNCHNPHGYNVTAGGNAYPYLLIAKDSVSADNPAYEMTCEACHDGTQGGVSKNIKTQLNKTYAHPTHTYNNRHTLPETGVSEGGSSFGPANRHAECVDCHNPHTVVSGTVHSVGGVNGNLVSDVLKYAWGVEPSSWPSRWTQPTSFTVRKPPTYPDGAQKEYQICFKCHSYYGLGNSGTPPVSAIIGPSGTNITDQAWEFNPNNRSGHPVVVSTSNITGSPAPKALSSTQMLSPWTSVGSQTMYCSDCHGADNESSGAKGPHGSARKYMLKGSKQYWPASPSGKLYSLNDVSGRDKAGAPYNGLNTNWANEIFCLNCHKSFGDPPSSSSSNWANTAHKEHDDRDYTPFGSTRHNVYCISCHTAVPHGMKRSRLIVYDNRNTKYGTDVPPYRYVEGSNNYAALHGYKKPASSPGGYNKRACWSTVSGCSDHNTDDGGYDTN